MKQKSIYTAFEGALIWECLNVFAESFAGLSQLGKALSIDGCFKPCIPRTIVGIEACIEAKVNPLVEGASGETNLRAQLLETIQETQLPIDIDLPTEDLQYQLSNHLHSKSPEELFLMGIFGRPPAKEDWIRLRQNELNSVFKHLQSENWRLSDFEALQIAVQHQKNEAIRQGTTDHHGDGNSLETIADTIVDLSKEVESLREVLEDKLIPAMANPGM